MFEDPESVSERDRGSERARMESCVPICRRSCVLAARSRTERSFVRGRGLRADDGSTRVRGTDSEIFYPRVPIATQSLLSVGPSEMNAHKPPFRDRLYQDCCFLYLISPTFALTNLINIWNWFSFELQR